MSVEAPETFLELCQRFARDARVGGTGPSATASQTGQNFNLVSWVVGAWLDIQNLHEDWKFLKLSASFTTVAGTALYTLGSGSGTVGVTAAAHGRWLRHSFRCYLTATGTDDEQELTHRDYYAWKNQWLLGPNRNQRSRPYEFTIDDAQSIGLGPVPAAGYTITGDYYRQPVILAADADEPAIDRAFRLVIVGKALMKYGQREGALNIYDMGETMYKPLIAQMERKYLPRIGFAGALA